MKGRQFIILKSKLSKGLLAAALFFSVFVFSGHTGNSQPQTPQKAYTELVFSAKSTAPKRAFFFKSTEAASKVYTQVNSPQQHICYLLLAHNRLYNEAFKCISHQSFSFKIALRFARLKTTPRSSQEDIFSSLVG